MSTLETLREEKNREKKLFYVGIIGSCGRTAEEQKHCCPLLWKRMLARAKFVIGHVWCLPLESIVLVSGGSAWSDHVAVALFLDQKRDHDENPEQWPCFAGIEVYTPTPMDSTGFRSTTRTGKRLNQLHGWFERSSQYSSRLDWKQLPASSIRTCTPKDDFMARNRAIAQRCTHLLAFPSSMSLDASSSGGTAYTWNQCPLSVDRIYVPWAWLLDKNKRLAYVRVFSSPQPCPSTQEVLTPIQIIPIVPNSTTKPISNTSDKGVNVKPSQQKLPFVIKKIDKPEK